MSTLTHPNTILGIDPGYRRCGFGVILSDGHDWTCLTHGVITTTGTDHAPRLKEIGDDFVKLLNAHKPDAIGLEELFFVQSKTTGLKVAEVRGVIMMLAASAGIKVIEVKPTEVKMALTGYGRADKRQIQEMVKNIFKFDEIPRPDDAADALAVAWTAASKLNLDAVQ
ncbi:crossover junction endodeoxyribonuclease RuvC [Patescibacteria group bacterium]|nr:crossover junction endodeoxyribonuclease RuvC [Patescibacteria group bacterium]